MAAVRSAAIDIEKAPENIRELIVKGNTAGKHSQDAFNWIHERVISRLRVLDEVALNTDKTKSQREGARENIKAIEASVADLITHRDKSKAAADQQ